MDVASSVRWMAVLAFALVLACGASAFLGWMDLPEPYLAGGLACVLAAFVRGGAGRSSAYLAGLTYGVYLVHPLVRNMCIRVGALPHDSAVTALVVVTLSMLFVAALRLTPLRRFV